MQNKKICPECKKVYSTPAALSRKNNKTLICPTCGALEVLDDARAMLAPDMDDEQWKDYKIQIIAMMEGRQYNMDKTLLNGSGCVDRVAYEAIMNVSRECKVKEKKNYDRDEAADALIKTLKDMIWLSGFKLLERIKLEDPKTGKKYL